MTQDNKAPVLYKARLCACGCGQEVRPRTLNRPARYVHGHNPVTPRQFPSLAERFWSRVKKAGPDECWNWTGGRDPDGRGRIWHEGRNVPAPRIALLLSGVEVPKGGMACHHCDNPNCVNPAHLYAGTANSNVADMIARGRKVTGSSPRPGSLNSQAKLNEDDVRTIRATYTGARGEQTALAQKFGVTQALIQLIVSGRAWKHV